jgi:hypothetical protein
MTALTLVLLVCPALFADPVADLRGTLERFKGMEAVKGRVDLQSWNKSGEGKKLKERQSSGQVQVEDGPQGLRLGWTAQQIQAARKDALAKGANPEAATPNLDSLRALDVADASRMLSYAEHLGLMLQGAILLEDRADTYLGKPARLLVLKPEARFSAEDKEVIKSFEASLKVWVGPDGVPVGLEEATSFKGSKFLITFKGSHSESTSLGRAGTRLVALRSTKETTGSGLGMSSQGKVVASLTLY